MKTVFQMSLVVALSWALGTGSAVWALTDDVNHNVTVSVGPILSLTAEDNLNFPLRFEDDFGTGAFSTGISVPYFVVGNNFVTTAQTDTVTGRISSNPLAGMTLRAFPGDYTNLNPAFAALQKVPPPAEGIVVGTTATPLYTKAAHASRMVRGRFLVHYRMRASRDLTAADGGTFTLTVTVKDT